MFTSSSWLPLFCIWFMFYLCYLYLFTYTGVQQFKSSRRLTVTWRVSLVEQKLPTLPEHLSTLPILMGFVLGCVFFCFWCVLQIIVCIFLFWPLYYLPLDLQLLIYPLWYRQTFFIPCLRAWCVLSLYGSTFYLIRCVYCNNTMFELGVLIDLFSIFTPIVLGELGI